MGQRAARTNVKDDERVMGFLCLKETGNAAVELAVMGVVKEYHRNGAGRALVEKAEEVSFTLKEF